MRSSIGLLALSVLAAACNAAPSFNLDRPPPDPNPGFPDAQVAGGDAGPGGPTWYQDIQPIVAARCQQCHNNPLVGGAPFALLTYEDTQRMWGTGVQAPVHQLMAARIEAAAGRMPPAGQTPLTEAERMLIRRWSIAGAPAGERTGDADGGVPPDGGATRLPWANGGSSPDAGPGARWIDTFAHAPGALARPFEARAASTLYECFSFTIPETGATDEYAVRFEPIFDNAPNVHHTFVFHNTNAPRPDYFNCANEPLLVGPRVMSGWFPGRGIDETPPGVGIRVQPGQQLILQVHYDSVPVGGIDDMSGVRVLLVDEPGLQDSGEFWSGNIWTTPQNGATVTIQGTCTLTTDTTIYRAVPHMHTRGRRIWFEVRRRGAATWDNLITVDPWDFHNQVTYALTGTVSEFHAGDQLRTTCEYESLGDPVGFGIGSADEMCLTMLNHYPLVYAQNGCIEYGP